MRLCAIARGLTVISIALMVGYAYLLEVRGPHWPVWPIEWRAVGEPGFMLWARAAPFSTGIAAHGPGCTAWGSLSNTFTPQSSPLL